MQENFSESPPVPPAQVVDSTFVAMHVAGQKELELPDHRHLSLCHLSHDFPNILMNKNVLCDCSLPYK